MIDRQHGEIIYECDACSETLETGAQDRPEAKVLFDVTGWRAEKAGPEWTHLCPRCAE